MTERLSIEGVQTALSCPRKYEFAHVDGLEPDADGHDAATHVDLLGRSICAALWRGESDTDGVLEVATDRLASLWADHDERYHSLAQREHERTVLEATLRAYAEEFPSHAAGYQRLAADVDSDLLGPDLRLSRSVSVENADESADETSVHVDATVDYVFREGPSLVAVKFVPTLSSLGLLRYRSEWSGDVETQFRDHFDSDSDTFEPGLVGALFETSVVLAGLRDTRDRLGLEGRCRYVQLPLADRSQTAVNWIRGTAEMGLEACDLTDRYVDEISYAMSHEHRNETVDSQLAGVVGRLIRGEYAPGDRWTQIADAVCPRCDYAVCCPEYVADEVRFDG